MSQILVFQRSYKTILDIIRRKRSVSRSDLLRALNGTLRAPLPDL
jgi:hypothetical protein